jgi:hypothetical protein
MLYAYRHFSQINLKIHVAEWKTSWQRFSLPLTPRQAKSSGIAPSGR